MSITYEPADLLDIIRFWAICDEIFAKAKELGSERENTEVVMRYEGIAPGGKFVGHEMVSVSVNGEGERFFY